VGEIVVTMDVYYHVDILSLPLQETHSVPFTYPLGTLPPITRNVAYMSYIDGLSTDERNVPVQWKSMLEKIKEAMPHMEKVDGNFFRLQVTSSSEREKLVHLIEGFISGLFCAHNVSDVKGFCFRTYQVDHHTIATYGSMFKQN